MKKLLTLTLALSAMTVFVSCGGDEVSFGDNELVIDGEAMPLVANWYYDSNRDLTNGLNQRADGIVTTHVERYIRFQDASTNNNAAIGISFYSKGTAFKNGTYTVKAYDAQVDADTESFAVIWVDCNDQVYGIYGFDGMSGKITISSDLEEINLNDMTLKFNLAGVAYVPGVARQDGAPANEVNVNVKGQFRGEIQLD